MSMDPKDREIKYLSEIVSRYESRVASLQKQLEEEAARRKSDKTVSDKAYEALQSKLRTTLEQVSELEQLLSKRSEQLEKAEQDVINLKVRVPDIDQIQIMKRSNESNNKTINELNDHIAQLQKEISTKNKEMEKQNLLITKLQDDIQLIRRKQLKDQNENAAVESELIQLQRRIDDLEAHTADLTDELEDQNTRHQTSLHKITEALKDILIHDMGCCIEEIDDGSIEGLLELLSNKANCIQESQQCFKSFVRQIGSILFQEEEEVEELEVSKFRNDIEDPYSDEEDDEMVSYFCPTEDLQKELNKLIQRLDKILLYWRRNHHELVIPNTADKIGFWRATRVQLVREIVTARQLLSSANKGHKLIIRKQSSMHRVPNIPDFHILRTSQAQIESAHNKMIWIIENCFTEDERKFRPKKNKPNPVQRRSSTNNTSRAMLPIEDRSEWWGDDDRLPATNSYRSSNSSSFSDVIRTDSGSFRRRII